MSATYEGMSPGGHEAYATSIFSKIKTYLDSNPYGYITSYKDTKNTAGSTDTSSKIFLIGATSQAANPRTYSHDTAYVGTDGCLYSGGTKVLTAHQDISGKADKTATVSTVTWSNNKLTKTINGTTSDVVSAATILGNLTSSQVTTALGFTPYNSTNPNGYTSNIGTITGIKMNGASKGTSGVVDLGTVITAHQDISGKADKSATVSNIAWSSNKLTKIINGTTSDVVSAATILNNLTSSQVTTALGFTPTANTGTITSVKTTAGAHTTINVSSGAANFNVPTKTSHLTNDSGYVTTDTKVTQTATDGSSNAEYEVLFSGTADNTTRTEGARKTSLFTFNPQTNQVTAGHFTAKSSDPSGNKTASLVGYDVQLGGTSNTWDGTNTSLKNAISFLSEYLRYPNESTEVVVGSRNGKPLYRKYWRIPAVTVSVNTEQILTSVMLPSTAINVTFSDKSYIKSGTRTFNANTMFFCVYTIGTAVYFRQGFSSSLSWEIVMWAEYNKSSD